MKVRGSVALVTGAAAGTGRAIALRLGVDGALVVVADVDPQAGQETVQAIEMHGGSAGFVQADVTSSDDIRRMVAFAGQELGGLQILVNNAGGGGLNRIVAVSGSPRLHSWALCTTLYT